MSRRLAMLCVTPEALIGLCKPGERHYQVVSGLPHDVKCAGVGKVIYDPETHSICVVLESATFAEVPEGQKLPELSAVIFRDLRTT